ncbi:MAG: PAS domain S-box protein [Bryobacteraceae bacterium]
MRSYSELADPRLAQLGVDSLRIVLDALPVALYLKDRDGRILFLNREWHASFGDLGAIVGNTPHESYTKELADKVVAGDERAFAEGGLTFEATRQMESGTRRFVVRRIVLRDTELGDLLIGICEDVTPWRTAERELRDERSIGETVLTHSHALLLVIDQNRRVVRFNRACEAASGLTTDQVMGCPYEQLFERPDEEPSVRHMKEVFETGEAVRFEAPCPGKRHEPRTVSWTWVPVKGPDNGVEFIVATGIDVSDQRRVERALKESEKQFRLLWERSNDGMRILDVTGRTLMVNEAYAQMVGRRQDELIGRPFWEVYAGPTAEEMRINWGLWNPREPNPFRSLQRLERADGSVAWLDLLVSEIEVPGGDSLILTIARDVTGSRRLAEQMETARAEAEAASAAKSQFLANMSHELRTPMNAILGLTSVVLETHLDSVQHDHLLLVKESAESLLRLLNDLLDFSKTDAGMMRLDPVPFRLQDTLVTVIRTRSSRISPARVELRLDLHEDVPEWLVGDSLRLRQVLLNLVGNALKFTERGSVTLEVLRRGTDDSGSIRLRFAVRDTGIGIPADKQEVIFEPFTQADGSTTRKYGGTGLGLSISSELVALMGGSLTCRSEVGVGSEFAFEVSFGSYREPDGLAPRLRILVAEDNRANQQLLCSLLEKAGHSVAVVDSGAEAVARASEEAFDLLLMDIQMPDLDGIAATRAIRDAERRRGAGEHAYIAAMTAETSQESRARCAESGMDGFLSKPIHREDLDAAISAATGRRSIAVPFEEPLMDVAAALNRVDGDRELLREVARLFESDYPRSITEIRDAIAADDALKVERSAHGLKGSVANFGAAAAVSAALSLETMGRSGNLHGAAAELERLEAVLVRLQSELSRL